MTLLTDDLEFSVVADCCRWPVSRQAASPRWARVTPDWHRVVRIAARQRVEGLVWNSLVARGMPVPEEPTRCLKTASGRIARQSLEHARESLRLRSEFQKAGIPILFLKGVALAALAYGTLALKSARDIDLLVRSEDIDSAAALLKAAGYRCVYPQSAAGHLREWHRLCKESVWRHPERDVVVELHSRLFDNPLLLPGIGVDKPWMVRIGDVELPALPRDDLFTYLCVHGAVSGWSRLKWLADFAAILAPLEPDKISELHARAKSGGAGRTASVALLLSERVLGLQLPSSLHRDLRRDWGAQALASVCLRKMTGRYAEFEIKERRLGILSIQLMQPFIIPKWSFALAEARRLSGRPEDRLELAFKRSSKMLLPLRLLARRLGRPFRRRSTRK